MKHNYFTVIAYLMLCPTDLSNLIAQTSGPEFLQCSNEPIPLCVEDEGIRLPANNQIYIGEDHPDATSCSVHVNQKTWVHSTCGGTLQYEVQLFLYDTSAAYILQPLTTITMDSTGEAELTYDSEQSPEEEIWLNGIPYSTGCYSYHTIKWIVRDSCGLESVCEQRINLYDCHTPDISVVSQLFLYYFNNSAFIQVYGEDLVSAEDDCTLWEEFLVSFDSLSHQPLKEFYFCDVPGFGIELAYNIWIADHGIDVNCDGTVAWNERKVEKRQVVIVFVDNTQTIDCFTGFVIEGEVRTENGEGIKDVAIELSSPGQVYPTYVTESDGQYSFYVESINGEAKISPYKNDFHKNGVSTLDLIKIQKHLLGIDTIDSPYQIIAADANNSQNVSAIDMIELRKLILGIYTELPNNTSWRFVRANYIFQDILDPWPVEDKETITITDIVNPGNLDFIGIKIGDINGTVQPNFSQINPRKSLPPIDLNVIQQSYHTGDILNVPIRVSSNQTLTGFQLTAVAAGMEILNILPGKIPIGDEHFAIFNDKMTISWFDENNVDVSSKEVLFSIQLQAHESGTLCQSLSINSDITAAEIYLDGEQTFLPVLNIQNTENETDLEITSCFPNPWKDQTTVSFYLPESGQVAFILFDAKGSEIKTTTDFLTKGYHQHQMKSSEFQERGVIIFEIRTSTDSVVRKMLVFD